MKSEVNKAASPGKAVMLEDPYCMTVSDLHGSLYSEAGVQFFGGKRF